MFGVEFFVHCTHFCMQLSLNTRLRYIWSLTDPISDAWHLFRSLHECFIHLLICAIWRHIFFYSLQKGAQCTLITYSFINLPTFRLCCFMMLVLLSKLSIENVFYLLWFHAIYVHIQERSVSYILVHNKVDIVLHLYLVDLIYGKERPNVPWSKLREPVKLLKRPKKLLCTFYVSISGLICFWRAMMLTSVLSFSKAIRKYDKRCPSCFRKKSQSF